MIKSPLVSVIVPIYNVQSYIKRCVNSLINQTYKHLEIILVDDGSNDNSYNLCHEEYSNEERVVLYHKENGGLSDARNFGIERSNGKFICFVDGDDEVSPFFVEKLIKRIMENNSDVAMCRILRVEKSKKYITRDFVCSSDDSILLSGDECNRLLFLNKIDCSACSKMYKSELFSDLRFRIGITNEDFDIMYKIFIKANNVIYISDPLYLYYLRENSITSSEFSLKQFDKIKNSLIMFEYIRINSPSLMRYAKFYLILQSFYLYKTLVLKRLNNTFLDESNRIRNLLRKNIFFIIFCNTFSMKEKLSIFYLTFFPKLYLNRHYGGRI